MTLRHSRLLFLLSLAFSLSFANASSVAACSDAKTITSATPLPFTITSGGAWCLGANRNWGTATDQVAITIDANDVVLDMQGYKLSGSNAGLGTAATGIYALDHRNITIRNGTIRGFFRGIWLDDDSGGGTIGGGYHIEDLALDENTHEAINIAGRNATIARNRITDTGGTTTVSNDTIIAVNLLAGAGHTVTDNEIRDFKGVGTGQVHGIWVGGNGAVIEHNIIGNSVAMTNQTLGIRVTAGRMALVTNNRLSTLTNGIYFFSPGTGSFRDNLAYGCTTPYTPAAVGGVNLGNNN